MKWGRLQEYLTPIPAVIRSNTVPASCSLSKWSYALLSTALRWFFPTTVLTYTNKRHNGIIQSNSITHTQAAYIHA